jgi:hypothetical protein
MTLLLTLILHESNVPRPSEEKFMHEIFASHEQRWIHLTSRQQALMCPSSEWFNLQADLHWSGLSSSPKVTPGPC